MDLATQSMSWGSGSLFGTDLVSFLFFSEHQRKVALITEAK